MTFKLSRRTFVKGSSLSVTGIVALSETAGGVMQNKPASAPTADQTLNEMMAGTRGLPPVRRSVLDASQRTIGVW
jgi:hypothetical protein